MKTSETPSAPEKRPSGSCSGGAPGHWFTLIEVVAAMGVLALLTTGAYSGLRLTERMSTHYVVEDTALEVLDNAVERLASEGTVTVTRATTVMKDEFGRSGLARDHGAALMCRETPNGVTVHIESRGHNRLAQIELPVGDLSTREVRP
jgi:prepilin-type N-terminal cleavage/methylation domain-containing protein